MWSPFLCCAVAPGGRPIAGVPSAWISRVILAHCVAPAKPRPDVEFPQKFTCTVLDPRQARGGLRAENINWVGIYPKGDTERGRAVDPLSVWHGDHARFSRLLAYLEKEMAAFHEGGDPNYQLMRDVVHYLHFYADRVHHPREDVAFERLIKRDPAYQFSIHRLLQEHRAIAVAGATLLELLEELLDDAILERAKIESAAALYLVYFRNHLATEERDILPRAALVLTPEDWAAVKAAISDVPDPLFGSDIAAEYRELREWINRTAQNPA